MLFVIDIGNTHTVAGVFSGERLARKWRVRTRPGATSDELAVCYHNLFSLAGLDPADIDSTVIASVVPQLDAAYEDCCFNLFGNLGEERRFRVNSKTLSGMISVLLDHPEEVGADRLANGIAAHQLYPGSCMVIDFGTAITFDCISETGDYLGGLILPGLNLAVEALARNTAKLPQIDLSSAPAAVIGTNTVEAMKSGVLHGYGAMIEGLIAKVADEMPGPAQVPPTVIATGGMASVIRPYAPAIQQVENDLTLKGMYFIHRHFLG